MAKPKRDLTRITINLPTHVLAEIDAYAHKHSLSRTTAIMIMCCDALASYQSPRDTPTSDR